MQMLIFKLLEKWGMDGFLSHTDKVAAFYEERRDILMESADRWLRGERNYKYNIQPILYSPLVYKVLLLRKAPGKLPDTN